jgi:hypothetical protein
MYHISGTEAVQLPTCRHHRIDFNSVSIFELQILEFFEFRIRIPAAHFSQLTHMYVSSVQVLIRTYYINDKYSTTYVRSTYNEGGCML